MLDFLWRLELLQSQPRRDKILIQRCLQLFPAKFTGKLQHSLSHNKAALLRVSISALLYIVIWWGINNLIQCSDQFNVNRSERNDSLHLSQFVTFLSVNHRCKWAKKVWFKGVGTEASAAPMILPKKRFFLKNRLKLNFITAIYVYLSGNDNGDLCSIERRSVNSVFTAKKGYIIYLFPCKLTKDYIFL